MSHSIGIDKICCNHRGGCKCVNCPGCYSKPHFEGSVEVVPINMRDVCDLCPKEGIDIMLTGMTSPKKAKIDGKTGMGYWALMCPECFRMYGRGLGDGVGQVLLSKPKGGK